MINYILDMIYMLSILVILILIPLLLRIRLKVRLIDSEKTLFVGLGRSGVLYDFKKMSGFIQIWNRTFKKIKQKRPDEQNQKKSEAQSRDKQKDKTKAKRVIPYREMFALIPSMMTALWTYAVSMMKSVIIEEMNGKIEAGFDSPDITGKVFGFYQAAYHAVPAVAGRIHYVPVWDETRFNAQMQLSVAIPLYKIIWRTIVLIFSLPLRDIIKLTIGKKERSHDGE
ncbi:MAG: hypothetical protein DWP97_10235 [Calditrichaeota bacterium]|nr:MAG: hypothetical protein DWP97_10235 [Calditrichota bacterium]